MTKSSNAFKTIREVADELSLPQHVLRFWETRFSQIKPMKRGGGRRYYRPEDIHLLRGIRHLLYAEGYTIKGAQRILKEKGFQHLILDSNEVAACDERQATENDCAQKASLAPAAQEPAALAGCASKPEHDIVLSEQDTKTREQGVAASLPRRKTAKPISAAAANTNNAIARADPSALPGQSIMPPNGVAVMTPLNCEIKMSGDGLPKLKPKVFQHEDRPLQSDVKPAIAASHRLGASASVEPLPKDTKNLPNVAQKPPAVDGPEPSGTFRRSAILSDIAAPKLPENKGESVTCEQPVMAPFALTHRVPAHLVDAITSATTGGEPVTSDSESAVPMPSANSVPSDILLDRDKDEGLAASLGRGLFGKIKGGSDMETDNKSKPAISKEDRDRLHETLTDLLECKRLLDQLR